MSPQSSTAWTQEKVDRTVREFMEHETRLPPYLANLLLALKQLESMEAGILPVDIASVDAAWEYEDNEEQASGFFVVLHDGQKAYIEQHLPVAAPSNAAVLVKVMHAHAGWADADASRTAQASGWVECPDEVNLFLKRMASW